MPRSISIAQDAIRQPAQPYSWEGAKPLPALLCILVGCILYALPHPAELSSQCWLLFSIFVATIVGIICKPLPVAPVVITGALAALCTNAVSFEGLFSVYGQRGIWLIVLSFFLAQGLVKSQLALRIAYHLVALCGASTLGLAYAILASELLLCPFVPSLVARSGGIIFPIVYALIQQSRDTDSQDMATPGFIILSAFHGSLICSNMFLTAMAGNPLCAEMAREAGVSIDWGTWALAASVPGAFCLITVPYLIYCLSPPSTTKTPDAPRIAREKLAELGPISVNEWLTVAIFSVVLTLWVVGAQYGINSATAALLGLGLMLIMGVLNWKDCLEQKTGWDTLVWLALIVGMGGQLKAMGFFAWLSGSSVDILGDLPWYWGFLALSLIYFYSHYLFASNIAHASAMFLAFLIAALEMGTPPVLAFFVLAFANNAFGGLTHYASGPAPLYFSAGYVSTGRWWTVGFILCTYTLFVWIGLGSLWWHYLGLW